MAGKGAVADDAAEVARLLREINHRYRDQAVESDIAQSGLTFQQVSAITVLYDRGPLSLKDLSSELGLSHSTVSGIVDRLERHGLVRRKVDGADRRVTRVTVTEPVVGYVEKMMPAGQVGRLRPALRRATREQRRDIKAALTLLHGLLEKD